MKLLITGGCGFVGSSLAQAALDRGDEVVVLDNLSRFGSAENLASLRSRKGFHFQHGDVRHDADVCELFARTRPDAVFHLAGQVAMTTSLERPVLDFETNALGTLNVLEAVRREAPRTPVLYSSSNKVYGDLEDLRYEQTATRWTLPDFPKGLPENLPFSPTTPYGCSKGAADLYLRDYAKMYGLRTIVFRHSSMYGGRQYATYDQGWVGWFTGRAVAARIGDRGEFTVSGDGKQVRDLLHSDDVCRLYFAALERVDRLAGQAFNVGGGIPQSRSVLELLDALMNLSGERLHWRHIEVRRSDQRVFVADCGLLESLLDWTPRVTVEEGLRRLYAELLARESATHQGKP